MPDMQFDWGIENTVGSKGQQLVDDFLNDTVTPDPDEVKPVTEENSDKEKETGDKKDNTKKDSQSAPAKAKTKEVDVLSILSDDDSNEEEEDKSAEENTEKSEDTKSKDAKSSSKKSEDKENKDKDESSEPENTEELTPFESLSRDLIKLGVFEDNEEDDIPQTDQEFLQRFNLEAQKRAQYALESHLSRFGEDRRQLFDAIFNKNVDPASYLESFVKVEKFSDMDMTKEANQEKVVRASMKNQGFDDEDVDSEVERLKEYGDLQKVSEKYHKAVVKQELKKLEEQAAISQQKLFLEEQRNIEYVNSVTNILNEKLKQKGFDGLSVTPAVAQKTRDFLVNKTWKLPSGELITDFDKFILDLQKPENFPVKIKLSLLALSGFDFNKISKNISSKENSELFDSLTRQQKKTAVKKEKPKEDLFSDFLGIAK